MIKENLISKIIAGDFSDAKTRILHAAITEFALRSLDGARTREIARQSESNLAAISYYFGGKGELYKTVIYELADYFDSAVEPYYKEGKAVIDAADSKSAQALAQKFLINCIRNFGKLEIVPALCLIMIREEASPSESFKRVYQSVYARPVEFLANLIITASKGRTARDIGIVFAQALWSNVRAYSAKSGTVMKLHGWREIGDAEIAVIETALKKVMEKTLK